MLDSLSSLAHISKVGSVFPKGSKHMIMKSLQSSFSVLEKLLNEGSKKNVLKSH